MADEGERCQVCGDTYTDVYRLPDEWWELVTPKPEHPDAGLLCPPCALRRLLSVPMPDAKLGAIGKGMAHDFYCTHDPCRCRRPKGLAWVGHVIASGGLCLIRCPHFDRPVTP